MIKFTLENKASYELATKWEELTVRQFLELKNDWDGRDFIKLLSILSKAKYSTIFKTKQVDVVEKLLPFMKWIETPPNFKMPSQIEIGGKKYDAPKGNLIYTFGQKISLQNKMTELVQGEKELISCIPFAIANYYQPIITGLDYDEDLAVDMQEMIMECKMGEAYEIGAFFLRKSIVSSREMQSSLILNRVKNKFARKLISWIFSKSSRRLTLLQKATF